MANIKEKVKKWWKKNWFTVAEYAAGATIGLAIAGATYLICGNKGDNDVMIIDCGDKGYFVTDSEHFSEAFTSLYNGMG